MGSSQAKEIDVLQNNPSRSEGPKFSECGPVSQVSDDKDEKSQPHLHSSTKVSRKRELEYFIACCIALFLAGWSDGTAGPLLPRMQSSYRVRFTVVSLIFILNCIGFVISAVSNVWLTDRLGFGRAVVLGSVCQLVAYAIKSPQPPFPLFVIAYAINGFGMGLQDALSNGLVAVLPTNPSGKMGIMHSVYGLGALISPLVATQFANKERWSFHFLTSLGVALLNTLFLIYVFRFRSQKDLLSELHTHPVPELPITDIEADPAIEVDDKPGKYVEVMRQRVVHLMALFIFVYVGVEVTIGGWMVTFVIEQRGAGSNAGYVSSGFFGGLTLGRVVLIWVNKTLGERLVIYIYSLIAIGLEITIWLVPSLLENAIAVSFVGLVLGPIYPIVMTVTSWLVPRRLLTGSIGWIASIGATGSAAFPFILAVIAQKHGVQMLQPLVVGMVGFMLVVWLFASQKPRGS